MCCWKCYKSCQDCLETIYWHCFEKHCCYDEEIALYEEEEPKVEEKVAEKIEEKNNNMYDNMAFYDNVALIANRSIFRIEPLKEHEVITKQPSKTKFDMFENVPPARKVFVIPLIHEHSASPEESERGSNSTLDTIREEVTVTPTTEKLEDATQQPNNLLETPEITMRKKSLQQRRLLAKSLTLSIDKFDIPLTRQSSFPKFYLDTPEANQTDSAIYRSPVLALETPVMPQSEFIFDLKSIVQMEKERQQRHHLQHQHSVSSKKFTHIRDKLKLNRHASTNSLHSLKE